MNFQIFPRWMLRKKKAKLMNEEGLSEKQAEERIRELLETVNKNHSKKPKGRPKKEEKESYSPNRITIKKLKSKDNKFKKAFKKLKGGKND